MKAEDGRMRASLPQAYYDDGDGRVIYHADCRDILPLLEPASVNLVLTDPPYGIRLPTNFASRRRGGLRECRHDYPPVHGDTEPFDPEPVLGFGACILWGANYYADRLPTTSGWLVWDKREGTCVNDQADAELAWTNCVKGVRVFRHLWNGLFRASERAEHYHPTQKPVALMQWCITKVSKTRGGILDPYMGSGPVIVAAKLEACACIGIEIEERYCEIAARRLSQEVFEWAEPVGMVS